MKESQLDNLVRMRPRLIREEACAELQKQQEPKKDPTPGQVTKAIAFGTRTDAPLTDQSNPNQGYRIPWDGKTVPPDEQSLRRALLGMHLSPEAADAYIRLFPSLETEIMARVR